MASPAEIERKVGQLDNDVKADYEMLATIEATQKRHGNRLNEIDEKVSAIADTQSAMADAQASQGEKLDAILELLRGDNRDV